MRFLALLILAALCSLTVAAQSNIGYYRFPAMTGNEIVFTAEGDLWKVNQAGGQAQRLTSHPGAETQAAISPDGKWVAFSGQYEGPTEVYVMPLAGGLPKRLTYDGSRTSVMGWTPDGKVLYRTQRFSTLPDQQLVVVDPQTLVQKVIPLSQASDGCYDATGKTLFFTRLPFQGSATKRYKGGSVEKLWKFVDGAAEAVPLTADFDGTSRDPMWWNGRLYFVS
ncbi:MAG TPA: protease, partial [Acidobacteriota bacterium]|nr:protease [Acidobacteriota bacterium]